MDWVLVIFAFVTGIAGDSFAASGHTINILALPLLLLILWNVLFYFGMVFNKAFQFRHFKKAKPTVAQQIELLQAKFYLNACATALAAGAMFGMYWRGLVFEYQAAWQSTFLSSQSVHAFLSFVLTPAAWLSGASFPDVNHVAQLQFPAHLGENAGRWIHWYAITVLLIIVLPRLILAWLSHQHAKRMTEEQHRLAQGQHANVSHSAATHPHFEIDPSSYTSTSTIALSLVSHTNVGKTTLARTLLGRDIGEISDAEHVTHTAEHHVLIETVHEQTLEQLTLWDTPGFGDSERLVKRMVQSRNPIAWFMSEVWDRFQNRDFWFSQRAVRHMVEESDVILYMINASATSSELSYLDAELKVLDLIGKPVVVILNQVEHQSGPVQSAIDLQYWRGRTAQSKRVVDVLVLDAFSRCWVQEGNLMQALEKALANSIHSNNTEFNTSRSANALVLKLQQFTRLSAIWAAKNQQRWTKSMDVLAEQLSIAILDKERIASAVEWTDKLKNVGAAVGRAVGLPGATESPKDAAMNSLAARLDKQLNQRMNALLELHHVDGQAKLTLMNRIAQHYALHAPQSEVKAALWGGAVTGALMGLKADVMAGGLTMGGGLLTGGVLGAISGAGVMRGYNFLKGSDVPMLTWSQEVLKDLLHNGLLAYLAVSHFGRGRGEWTETEPPKIWLEHIQHAMDFYQRDIVLLLQNNRKLKQLELKHELHYLLIRLSKTVLFSLYPETTNDQLAI
ncbi:MAG TPA: DUF2868 domain-containing protein [Burkholderiaceae bacterium]|nr:DUF2868 domain-containing protein [Burkholderiaceae bacterium]